MRRRAKKPKRVYAGELGAKPKQAIGELLDKRKDRAKKTVLVMKLCAPLQGAMLGPATLLVMKNPSLAKGIAAIVAWAAEGAAFAGGLSQLAAAPEIRKATHLVGKGLTVEAKKRENKRLRNFLGKYRYVIVDGKGNVKGTNRERVLELGRIRLETKKILESKY